VHEGHAGFLLRSAGILTGPAALILRAAGICLGPATLPADPAFLAGGITHRFGWIEAGHTSGRDPGAAFASMRPESAATPPICKPSLTANGRKDGVWDWRNFTSCCHAWSAGRLR
jgi:hypothetical protein